MLNKARPKFFNKIGTKLLNVKSISSVSCPKYYNNGIFSERHKK